MSYPGITFVLMVSVAIGSALYYYLHGDWRQQNEQYEYTRRDDYRDHSNTFKSSNPEGSKKRKKGSKQEQCMICLDFVKESSMKVLTCGHNYHSNCIRQWFGINKTCPVCRSPQQFL